MKITITVTITCMDGFVYTDTCELCSNYDVTTYNDLVVSEGHLGISDFNIKIVREEA